MRTLRQKYSLVIKPVLFVEKKKSFLIEKVSNPKSVPSYSDVKYYISTALHHTGDIVYVRRHSGQSVIDYIGKNEFDLPMYHQGIEP